MAAPVYYTADMVRELPDDGNRYEVELSPSTAVGDRFPKRLRFREAGVPLYWVVDGEEQSVEIWRPADDFPAVEHERLVWHPAGAREPFTLSLEELFRPL